MSQLKFLVSPGRRIALLLLTSFVGLIIAGFVSVLLMKIGGDGKIVAMTRIAVVAQDVFWLILPAVVTAMVVTRRPVSLLAIGRVPTWPQVLLALLVLIVSAPLMSWIVTLNESVHFPESLAGLESWLREQEDSAASAVQMMLGAKTPVNLIVSIMLMGVMAGFSEELFFRGAFQRLLSTARMSPAAAIWISAVVFSAVHFQFFGFVPRMLLGAFFGYLLVWSGSVWLPMLVHAVNNSLYVILQYSTGSGDVQLDGAAGSWAGVVLSGVLTAAGLYLLYSRRTRCGNDD